jgi:hypothetical protein
VKSPEGHIEKSLSDGNDKQVGQSISRESAVFGLKHDLKRGASTNSEVGNLAFMSIAGATRELQFLKLSNPDKYGNMSLDQIRQHKLSEDIGNRDKMSFMSLAICNPFFLMGLGAAFAVMDEIRAGREGKLKNSLKNGTVADGSIVNGARRQVKGESIEEIKAKQADLRPRRLTPEAIKMLGLDKTKKSFSSSTSSDTSYLKYGLKKAGSDRAAEQPAAKKAEVSEKVKQKLFTGVESGWEEKAAARSLKNWIKTDQLIKKKQALGDQMERIRGREQFGVIAGLAAKIELVDKALKRQGT